MNYKTALVTTLVSVLLLPWMAEGLLPWSAIAQEPASSSPNLLAPQKCSWNYLEQLDPPARTSIGGEFFLSVFFMFPVSSNSGFLTCSLVDLEDKLSASPRQIRLQFGLGDDVPLGTKARVVALLDGKPWRSTILTYGEPAQDWLIPISGVKSLSLRVEAVGNSFYGNARVYFARAHLESSPISVPPPKQEPTESETAAPEQEQETPEAEPKPLKTEQKPSQQPIKTPPEASETEPEPSETEEQPAETEEPESEQQPPETEEEQPESEQQPAETEQEPPETEEQPAGTEAEPSETEEEPAEAEQEPSETEEQPESEEEPAEAEQEPSETEQEPSETEEEQPESEEEPAETEQEPAQQQTPTPEKPAQNSQ